MHSHLPLGARVRRGLLLLLVAGALTGCLGPKPVIVEVHAQTPTTASDPYHVQVIVENRGPGDGEIGVSLRLVDPHNGQTVIYDQQRVDLVQNERQSVDFSEELPPGGPPAAQLTPQANTEYPIK